MSKKIKRKIKWKNIFLCLIFLICLGVLFISVKKIITWFNDNNDIKNQMDGIYGLVEIEEIEDNENTEIIEQDEEIDKDNPYWYYIKMNLINVDFDELKEINPEIVGWIQVGGTNINYPFVQTTDNKYYLTHSIDKTYNQAGWVFLDYRNNIKSNDKNTIIYAHSRLNNTMFGTLKKTLKEEWLENTDNHIIKMATETEITLWQVFSVYHIPETSDYLKINFESNEKFTKFTDMLINRSAHDFKTTVSVNDRILTLSTCYGNEDRMVLHAKLIKREIK